MERQIPLSRLIAYLLILLDNLPQFFSSAMNHQVMEEAVSKGGKYKFSITKQENPYSLQIRKQFITNFYFSI